MGKLSHRTICVSSMLLPLEVFIPMGLRVCFSEVRVLKELAADRFDTSEARGRIPTPGVCAKYEVSA